MVQQGNTFPKEVRYHTRCGSLCKEVHDASLLDFQKRLTAAWTSLLAKMQARAKLPGQTATPHVGTCDAVVAFTVHDDSVDGVAQSQWLAAISDGLGQHGALQGNTDVRFVQACARLVNI